MSCRFKISPDGSIHKTFKETVLAMGLLESDEEWHDCMSEAAVSFMPRQLRALFVTILVFGEPANALLLWEKHKKSMGEDLLRDASMYLFSTTDDVLRKHVKNEVLLLLQEELEALNTCLQNFGLPIPEEQCRSLRIPKVIQDEIFDVDIQMEISEVKQKSLNSDQREAFHTIMKAVHNGNYTPRVFSLNAPGGCGKTFCIEALLSTVRGIGKIALAVASSGIVAELLEGGRTAHSWFKIPIPINESSMCSVDMPFGGIPIVFGGDPRQILPIVHHGN